MQARSAFNSAHAHYDQRAEDTKRSTTQAPERNVCPACDDDAESGQSRHPRPRAIMAASRVNGPEFDSAREKMPREMPRSQPKQRPECYLFVTGNDEEELSRESVFFQTSDIELAESLCRLCQRAYGDGQRFIHKSSSSFSPDEQVLLDEKLDDLSIYDDPDPGIYDPKPTTETLRRAEYARRAQRWEEMLQQRRERADSLTQPVAEPQRVCHAESNGCGLADDVLLQICRIAADDPELTTQHVDDLRKVCSRIGPQYRSTGAQLELALSLLTSVLGSFSRFNPSHLPFGYSGPTIKSHGWLDRDALEQVAKQIVGLMWADCSPDRVAFQVEHAISEAIRLGFMEEKRYDAWRPGMRSGSGWRSAVMATPYGVMKAGQATSEEPTPPLQVVSNPGKDSVNDHVTTVEYPDWNLAVDGPSRKLRQLRDMFDAAVARLEDIPETELSPSGQPFVRECADAIQAFADWFGEQTPDDLAIAGNAHRVLYTLSGLSGVIDWIALRWSVPFANELESEVATLVDEADQFDDAVVQAYRVPSPPHELRLERRPLPDHTYEKLEQRICEIASLASRLGQRLHRVAIWSSSPCGFGGPFVAGNWPVSEVAAIGRNAKSKTRRGMRAANIEKLEKVLENHLLAARDHAQSLRDCNQEPALLPRPTQKELAHQTGLTQSDVSRCLKDERAKVLRILWETADSLEEVMRYKRRR